MKTLISCLSLVLFALFPATNLVKTPPAARATAKKPAPTKPVLLRPMPYQITSARNFAATRQGQVSWAVIDTRGTLHAYRGTRQYRTASVVKAMILLARLRQHGNRPLSTQTRRDLESMIRNSDNNAAIRQYRYVCAPYMRRLAKVVDMNNFVAPDPCNWGTIKFSAIDQAKLFYKIDTLMPKRHRYFGITQLRSINKEHQWGLAQANNGKWTLAFKGGWLGQSCGQIEHQVGLFTKPGLRWSLAVLTECNSSSSYGRNTQYEIARRLR